MIELILESSNNDQLKQKFKSIKEKNKNDDEESQDLINHQAETRDNQMTKYLNNDGQFDSDSDFQQYCEEYRHDLLPNEHSDKLHFIDYNIEDLDIYSIISYELYKLDLMKSHNKHLREPK